MTRVLLTTFFLFSQTAALADNFGLAPQSQETLIAQQQLVSAPAPDANDDGGDRYLYRPLVELLSEDKDLSSRWLRERDGKLCLRAYNQGNVGSCVGNATALCVSIIAAWQIIEQGKDEELVAMAAADGLYGLSREAGGMLSMRGDGSTGYAAARAIRDLGTLWQLEYEGGDLRDYSAARCRKYGSSGVPSALKKDAAEHLVITTYAVTTFDDAWAAIGRGNAINVCSTVGFDTCRDATGTCQPRGNWGHSMAVIGRRTLGGRRQLLIQNSWGDDWNAGPYDGDQPWGSFWIDTAAAEKMLSQQDSYAYEMLGGFQADDDGDLNWIKF